MIAASRAAYYDTIGNFTITSPGVGLGHGLLPFSANLCEDKACYLGARCGEAELGDSLSAVFVGHGRLQTVHKAYATGRRRPSEAQTDGHRITFHLCVVAGLIRSKQAPLGNRPLSRDKDDSTRPDLDGCIDVRCGSSEPFTPL